MYSAFQFHLWTRPCAWGNWKGRVGGERQRASGHFVPKARVLSVWRGWREAGNQAASNGGGNLQNSGVFEGSPYKPTTEKPAKTKSVFAGFFLQRVIQLSYAILRRQPWHPPFPQVHLLPALPKTRRAGRKPGTKAPDLPAGKSQSAISRYIKVTICARVQFMSGLNVVLLVPFVMPSLTAHATASA